jgi:hypothetical protein
MSIAYQFNPWGKPNAIDFKTSDSDPDYTYMGYAAPGTAVDEPGWMIFRITKNEGNDATGRWADGQNWQLNSPDPSIPPNTRTWVGRASYAYLP